MRDYLSETSGPQRLLWGCAVGGLAAVLPSVPGWQFRGLTGWCAGVATYLLMSWYVCVRLDAKRTRERAQAQDEPSVILLLLLLCATFACVGAIVLMVQKLRGMSGGLYAAHLLLSVCALALSWLFIQTMFAFRYAHRYYQADAQGTPHAAHHASHHPAHASDTHRGGLLFPGPQAPDYFDFLYYAGVIGMTSQVSDVQVLSHSMRRLTLLHGLLSFGFNMLVLALSINVVAGVLQGG